MMQGRRRVIVRVALILGIWLVWTAATLLVLAAVK